MKLNNRKYLLIVLLFTAQMAHTETLTLKECLQKADKNHPALKNAVWDTRIAQENIRLASSANYPKIDAQAAYTLQQAAQVVVINGMTAETQQPDYASGGVLLGYTIYDFGRRRSGISQARLLSGAATDRYAFRKDISLQIIESYFSILELNKLAVAAGSNKSNSIVLSLSHCMKKGS